MNKVIVPAAVLVGAFVLAAVAYLIAPSLRSPQAAVDEAAARHAEKARRLLWSFSENEDRLATLLAGLDRSGVNIALPDEQIERMIDSDNRKLLAAEEERLATITGDASFANFGRNVPSMTAAVREGRQGRDAILAENDRLLSEALIAADEALSVRKGDASGAANPLTNRLKAIVLFHQGVAAHRKAELLRYRAQTQRRTLVALAQKIHVLQADADLLESSDVDRRIAEAQARVKESREQRSTKQAEVEKHQAVIDDVAGRLEQARATAEQARTAMESLEDRGLDLADPDGFEKFRTEYTAQAETYRRAIREAEELEFGTFKSAPGDESGSEEIQHGLVALRHDLTQLNAELASLDERIEAGDSDVAILTKLREQYATTAQTARTRMADLRSKAQSVYAEFERLIREAEEKAENEAIRKLKESVRSCKTAATEAARRVSDAASVIAPPQRLERMPAGLIQQDQEIEANIRCQQAGALIRLAMVYYDRYRDAAGDAELLADIRTPLALEEIDTTALAPKRDQAVDAGIEAATDAAELAARTSDKLDRHWTVPALVADARYLLVLFGQEDLRDNVIENYRALVDGREDDPFVKTYRDRLESLERRD